jgi:hypothetical protein
MIFKERLVMNVPSMVPDKFSLRIDSEKAISRINDSKKVSEAWG